jgi:hypothetical protein
MTTNVQDARIAALEAELADLRNAVRATRSRPESTEILDAPLSRRALLGRLGGIAAVGAGAAAGATLLTAAPASAATGDFAKLGNINGADKTTFFDKDATFTGGAVIEARAAVNGNTQDVDGVKGTGSNTFSGVAGFGGGTNGTGLFGMGGGTAGPGIRGIGAGVPIADQGAPGAVGVLGVGGQHAAGVRGIGGKDNFGLALGIGVEGVGGSGSFVGAAGVRGEGGSGGVSGGGHGVYGKGSGTGRGVVAEAGFVNTAQLQLAPSAAAPGPPQNIYSAVGDVFMDSTGQAYICTVGGSSAIWTRVGQVRPKFESQLNVGGVSNFLPSPIRLVDTRGGSPLPASTGTSGTIDLAVTNVDVGGIKVPSGATGVIGTVAVISTGAPNGYLTLYPKGVTPPNASTVNWFGANQILAAAFTCRLDGSGHLIVHNGGVGGSAPTHLTVDIVGFVF